MRVWLKDARENKGMTMKAAADELNISESYYCSIENGTRQKRMDITLASKISVVFGVPLAVVVQNETAHETQVGGGTNGKSG